MKQTTNQLTKRLTQSLILGLAVVSFSHAQAQTGGAVFQAGPPMQRAKIFPTATLLDNGKVITFAGREVGFISCAWSDLYDPATNTFTENAMGMPHDGSATVKLSDGRYLLLGGAQDLGVAPGYATAEQYNPTSGTFSNIASMTMARCNHSAAQLSSGKVLVVGAWYNTSGASQPELYDTASNTFVATTGTLNTPRSSALVLPTDDGGAVIAGGWPTYGGAGYTEVEYYQPASGTFSVQSAELIPADPGWLVSTINTRTIQDSRMSNGKYILLAYRSNPSTEFALIEFDPATKVFSKLNTASPLKDSLTDGGFADLVLNKSDNMAYLIGFDSGYDPQRVCVVTVNLGTGELNHPTTTYTLPTQEYFYASYTYLPASGKILVQGINGGNAGYFTGTNKTYFLTPQITVGVEQSAGKSGLQVSAYPNPAQGQLNLRLQSDADRQVDIRLTDLTGRVVLMDRLQHRAGQTTDRSYPLGHLAPGMYFLSCGVGSTLNTQTIVITR